jgi:hypothetical protein
MGKLSAGPDLDGDHEGLLVLIECVIHWLGSGA